MKKMIRDEHGVVNNRGISKYWGVTVAMNPLGKHYWVISYKPADRSETVSLRPIDFNLTETEAAKIAAACYDLGQSRTCLNGLHFLSDNRKNVFTVRGVEIRKTKYNGREMLYNPPVLNNLFGASDNVVPPVKAVSLAPKTVKSGDKDSEYFNKILALVSEGHLSEKSSRALVAVLTTIS